MSPQGRSGRVRKISLLQGFVPRTVGPVAIRYTDRAIAARLQYQDVIVINQRLESRIYSATSVTSQ